MDKNNSVINIIDLVKTYQLGKIGVRALRGANLQISAGEFVAIMGPSGSGKSTLMNIIGCLDIPTSGKYFLDGVDVGRLNDNQLATIRNEKVGFVFQTFNLLTRSNIFGNVELPLIYSKQKFKNKKRTILDAIDAVGLLDWIKHRPNELSGGEKQRVAIARALVNNPSIILADEPTGNLDSESTEQILSIFRKLHQEGITIILVTHEMDIAEQSQRIVRLHDGRIISDKKTT